METKLKDSYDDAANEMSGLKDSITDLHVSIDAGNKISEGAYKREDKTQEIATEVAIAAGSVATVAASVPMGDVYNAVAGTAGFIASVSEIDRLTKPEPYGQAFNINMAQAYGPELSLPGVSSYDIGAGIIERGKLARDGELEDDGSQNMALMTLMGQYQAVNGLIDTNYLSKSAKLVQDVKEGKNPGTGFEDLKTENNEHHDANQEIYRAKAAEIFGDFNDVYGFASMEVQKQLGNLEYGKFVETMLDEAYSKNPIDVDDVFSKAFGDEQPSAEDKKAYLGRLMSAFGKDPEQSNYNEALKGIQDGTRHEDLLGTLSQERYNAPTDLLSGIQNGTYQFGDLGDIYAMALNNGMIENMGFDPNDMLSLMRMLAGTYSIPAEKQAAVNEVLGLKPVDQETTTSSAGSGEEPLVPTDPMKVHLNIEPEPADQQALLDAAMQPGGVGRDGTGEGALEGAQAMLFPMNPISVQLNLAPEPFDFQALLTSAIGVAEDTGEAPAAVSLSIPIQIVPAYEEGSTPTDVGVAIANGFISGMNSRMDAVRAKAREIAQAAIKAANAELGVNSPSRVFRGIGQSVVEGFVVGIDKNLVEAQSAMERMVYADKFSERTSRHTTVKQAPVVNLTLPNASIRSDDDARLIARKLSDYVSRTSYGMGG